MGVDKSVELKKAIFYSDKIVIKKKKGNIVLNIEDIDYILYHKFSIWTFIPPLPTSYLWALEIVLKKEKVRKKIYYLSMRYKTVLKIQAVLKKEIDICY